MSPDPRVLEANLRLLFERAYAPIVPEARFRARLARLCVERSARRPRHPLRLLRPALFAAAAAAALWLLVLRAFGPPDAPPGEDLSVILARGDAAVREGPEGESWYARDLDAGEPRLLPAGSRFEVATPVQAGVRVDFAPLGGVELLASTHASLAGRAGAALDPSGARGVEVALERGGCVVELGPGAAPWSVTTAVGALELEHGRLRAAHEQPQGFLRPLDPATGPGAPVLAETLAAAHPGAPWLRARLHSGRGSARAAGGDAVQTLAAGDEVFLSHGTLYLVGLDPLAVAEGRQALEAPVAPVAPGAPVEGGGTTEPAPAIQLTGRVHHQGTPVETFRVGLLRSQDLPAVAEPEFHELGPGSAGVFELAGLVKGQYEVFVQAAGFATWRRAGLAIGDAAEPAGLECALVRGATVRGIVVDAARGLPLAGAVVLSEVDSPAQVLSLDESQLPPEVLARTTSQADGGFELTGLAPGEQSLRVRHPDFAPQWIELEPLADGELRDGLEVALRGGGDVEGQVLDALGRPVARGVLVLSPADSNIARRRLSFLHGVTDADGRYAMRALAPGRYVVLYFGEEQAAASGRPLDMVFVVLQEGGTARADFGAGHDTVLARGRLSDAAGAPLAERSLSLLRVHAGTTVGEEMRSTTSDGLGRWEVANLRPGTYEFYLSGRTPVEVTYQGTLEIPGTAPVFEHDLVVAGGTLSGFVRALGTDEPLEAFVVLELERPGASRFMAKGLASRAAGFRLEHLPQGSYRLTAYPLEQGRAYERKSGVWLAGGGQATQDLALGPGREVRVLVADASGAPVVGAEIELVDAAGVELLLSEHPVTASDGSLPLPGLKLEPLLVRVRKAGFSPFEQRFDVAALPNGEIRVVLAPE